MYQIIGFARASFTLCHLSPSCLLWNIVKYVVIPLSVPRDCVIRLALIMSHDKSTFILMLLYILQKGTLHIFLASGGTLLLQVHSMQCSSLVQIGLCSRSMKWNWRARGNRFSPF